jgi:hypothetical protein
MIALHVIGGVAAMALGVYMIQLGRARDGEVRPFLRSGSVQAAYLMAVLALLFGGAAWAVASAVALF